MSFAPAASEIERAAMLRDILEEIRYTREEIGKDAFAERIMEAMASVPRELFVPDSHRLLAFANGPVPIGHGQTISQPYIVALMTDLLEPRPEHVVLEVGTGSGYQAAVLSGLVSRVYSVEIIAALADAAAHRLASLGCANVSVRHADGYQGWPEHAPFDGIVVTAAASHVPPPLVEQLKPGGRLVIPVGLPGCIQQLLLIAKGADGRTEQRDVLSVAFVPLTSDLR